MGQLLDWFSDYLTERSQRGVIDGTASVRLPVTSGVHGSHVDPLLSMTYINNLSDAIHRITSKQAPPCMLMIPTCIVLF